jgi:hypothetical protein
MLSSPWNSNATHGGFAWMKRNMQRRWTRVNHAAPQCVYLTVA